MNPLSDRVIVTGGAGFIGSCLTKRLVKEGKKVVVIDNLWRGTLENLIGQNKAPVIDIENDFYFGDLTDYRCCLELIQEAEMVYHLADVVGGVHFAFQEEAFIFRQNMLINTNVLAACVANSIPNYVYVGTACSYPAELQMHSCITKLHEDQAYPAEPESSYGWSKLMGEYEALIAQKTGNINVGLLRLHNVYGPGSSPDPRFSQVLPSLMRKAVLYPKEPFMVWGDGDQYRDFIYVDDVVDALILVADKGMNQGVIQIGSENATTIKEVVKLIIDISGKPIKPAFDASRPQGNRGRISVCDRAHEIINWEPRVEMRDGFQRTYDWVKKKVLANSEGVIPDDKN